MMTRTRGMLLTVLGLLVGQQVGAGLLDSAPPTLNGVAAQVIYRMGPVYYHPGEADTVITCNSFDDVGVSVAIELFDQSDNPVGTLVQAALAKGGTVTFVTSADAKRGYWVLVPDLAPLDHGKARVSATTTKLSCAAYHRLRAADGTVQEKALELVKKIAR